MKPKLVYLGEWVRVAGCRNKDFPNDGQCVVCLRATCGVVYYNFKTEKVLCVKHFKAMEQEAER